MNQGQGKRQLYLVMTDKKHSYCLYRIEEPQFTPGEDETTIKDLGKPLLEMDESMFPTLMDFAAVDSRIYMVGGLTYDKRKERTRVSKKVFIYDTESSALSSGPKLNSAKLNPRLITLGTKIFVLSDTIHAYDSSSLDREPRFEMLDTKNLKRGWSPLPSPKLNTLTTIKWTMFSDVFSVHALTAVFCGGGGIIVLSICDAGTYVFDVDKQVWNYVTDELLPFEGTVMSLPHDPSWCCAFSLKSQRFSAFRFCYGGGDESNSGFHVEEIRIDDTNSFSPPLLPDICNGPSMTVSGHGLVYFVNTGFDDDFDDEESTCTSENRYVIVSALQLSNVNHGFSNKGQSLKRCGMAKKHIAHREDKKNETTELEVGLNKAKSSKRGKKKRKMEHVEEEEELILTRIWRNCFFGGLVTNAFAM
ncbi:uncharacterized protein LOC141658576 [Silene latifolia]|uniref:uncharacterized protein LOC141658576 n=1 Tax=Silene latifolia TaxID=37657 RepID=UPI003D76B64F